MKYRRGLAFLMAVFMLLTLLPAAVFGEEHLQVLGGKLKIRGTAAVGQTLSADYMDVTPEGVSDEVLIFLWSRKGEDPEPAVLSREKTYTVAKEDLGHELILKVSGNPEKGFRADSTLQAVTGPVSETVGEEGQDSSKKQKAEDAEQPAEETVEDFFEGVEETEETFFVDDADESWQDSTQAFGNEPAEEPDPEEADPEESDTGEQEEADSEENWFEEAGTDDQWEIYGEDGELLAVTETEEPEETDPPYETAFPEETGDPDSNSYIGLTEEFEEFQTQTDQTFYLDENGIPVEAAGAETKTQGIIEYFDENGPEPDAYEDQAAFQAEISTENGEDYLDFGILGKDYADDPSVQYITLTNTGTYPLHFEDIHPEHFMVDDVGQELLPGESVILGIRPREGLESGNFQDVIEYPAEEGISAAVEAIVTIDDGKIEENLPDYVVIPESENDFDVRASQVEERYTELLIDTLNGTEDLRSSVEAASAEEPETTGEPDSGERPEPTVGPVSYEEPVQVSVEEPEPTQTPEPGEEPDPGEEPSPSEDPEPAGEPQPSVDPEPTGEAQPAVDPKPTGEAEPAVDREPTGEAQPAVDPEPTGAADPAEEPFPSVDPLPSDGPAPVEEPEPSESPVPSEEPVDTPVPTEPPATPPAVTEAPVQTPVPSVTQEAAATPVPSPVPSVTVTATPTPTPTPEPVYMLEVSPAVYDFGAVREGYPEVPGPKLVTVTNTGNQTVHLVLQDTVFEHFHIIVLPDQEDTLRPGESCSFQVQPEVGLPEKNYKTTIPIRNKEKVSAAVTVSLSVTKKAVRLVTINNPAEISGIPNGTEATTEGLKLPSVVTVVTTEGNRPAAVAWDIPGSGYDPSVKTAQTITVHGNVTLPEGIENPDNIGLTAAVKVKINGRSPRIPDPSGNQILGISSSEEYTIESKISFTASGAGMENEDPVQEDIRYLPVQWYVKQDSLRSFDSIPCSATFRMAAGGNYALTVVFDQQVYTEGGWQKTGVQDVKTVNFSVKGPKPQNPTVTPSPASQGKSAVRTGDDTLILPFAVAGVMAVIVIILLILLKRKRK